MNPDSLAHEIMTMIKAYRDFAERAKRNLVVPAPNLQKVAEDELDLIYDIAKHSIKRFRYRHKRNFQKEQQKRDGILLSDNCATGKSLGQKAGQVTSATNTRDEAQGTPMLETKLFR